MLVTLENQPAGRLRKIHDRRQNDHREDDLEGNRESPGDGAGIQKRESKIQPVADADATGDQRAFNHDELSAAMRLGAFRLPSGNGRSVQAVADSGDDTTDDEVWQFECASHDDGPDHHDRGTQKDGLAAAEQITQEDTHDGPNEAADIVRGYGNTCRGERT